MISLLSLLAATGFQFSLIPETGFKVVSLLLVPLLLIAKAVELVSLLTQASPILVFTRFGMISWS